MQEKQQNKVRELRKVVIISTIDHNPGDDFIRLGQEYLLSTLLPHAQFRCINKHDPRTLWERFVPGKSRPNRLLMPFRYRLRRVLRNPSERNFLDDAELVVFAGAPFIWRQNARIFPSTCANAEWVNATWNRLFSELRNVPVLNLAAGTSTNHAEDTDRILADTKVAGFLRRALARTALTTARDSLTQEIANRLGFRVPLLPCTAVLSPRRLGVSEKPPEYVVLNVMPFAVHRARGMRTDARRWHAIISRLVSEIEARHAVLFISHSRDEDAAVREWFPGRPRLFNTDPRVLLEAYSKARFAVCNRVHAAAAVAAFHRPAIVIGGDTRSDLVRVMGLPVFDHRTAEHSEILRAIEEIEINYRDHVARLARMSWQAEADYLRLIGVALDKYEAAALKCKG